jgi:hypothetical protein
MVMVVMGGGERGRGRKFDLAKSAFRYYDVLAGLHFLT